MHRYDNFASPYRGNIDIEKYLMYPCVFIAQAHCTEYGGTILNIVFLFDMVEWIHWCVSLYLCIINPVVVQQT